MKHPRETAAVIQAMIDHIGPFVTPVSRVIEHDYGELEGSGSYIRLRERHYLFTNEHVAARRTTNSIAHKFHGCSDVFRTYLDCPAWEYPQDVALCEIAPKVWNDPDHPHNAMAIPLERFANRHCPIEHELLFLMGYAGERSGFYFGALVSPATPYLTEEAPMPSDFGNPEYHFAIHYNPEEAEAIEEGGRPLPVPPGLSGSVVWNTRFLEVTANGGTWSPDVAQVTGIVWGWPSADRVLLATKVEYFHLEELLDEFARRQKPTEPN